MFISKAVQLPPFPLTHIYTTNFCVHLLNRILIISYKYAVRSQVHQFPSLKRFYHCTDFYECHKCSTEFRGDLLHPTSPISVTKYGPYVIRSGTAVAQWLRCRATNRKVLVRSQMVSLEFFIDIILPIALWPWGRLSL